MALLPSSANTIKIVTNPRSPNPRRDRYNPRSVAAVVILLCALLVALTALRAEGNYLPTGEWGLIRQQAESESFSTDFSVEARDTLETPSSPKPGEESDKSPRQPQKSDGKTLGEPTRTTVSSTATGTVSAAESQQLPPPPLHPKLGRDIAFIELPPSERPLTPLRDHDYDKYSIRILSWKRAPFLAASVAHHSTCPGVEQIQIVWSIVQEDDDPAHTDNVLPEEVLNNPKVAVERRETNLLTNRFDIRIPTKTLAILSLDDDVLYPCDVLDMGFFKWTQNPDRLITYFPRKHVVNRKTGKWQYSYWRGVEYSMALTGTAFIHRDYLYWYTHFLPRPIYSYIQDNMNCEDVAMSLFVSKLTNGRKPLAVDKWGMHCRVQLALKTGYSGIKNAGGHMQSRNSCVDDFANQLNVKEQLGVSYYPGVLISVANYTVDNPRHHALEENRRKWMELEHKQLKQMYHKKRKILEKYAIGRGLSHQGSG